METTFTTRTDLYLGSEILGEGRNRVTLDAFSDFLETYVTPRFPGFTVTNGLGYWEGKPEGVRILSVLHHGGAHDGLQEIAETYKRVFKQEAVLIVDTNISGRLI